MAMIPSDIRKLVAVALAEDAPFGDITSATFIDANATATAQLVARVEGIAAGLELFVEAFTALDPTVAVQLHHEDGERFKPGSVLATVHGPARSVLQSERVGLNFVQRLSGVATLTARYVEAVAHTGARIVDTRKTTPGLRAAERHAVRCGGGFNHRYSLSDAVMLKDNHLALMADITEGIRAGRAQLPHTTRIEVEIDRLDQLGAVLAGEPDIIMLDNFTLADLATAVQLIDGRAITEASGGVNLDSVAAIAETGVDVISVGALTHSAVAIDLGLDISVQ